MKIYIAYYHRTTSSVLNVLVFIQKNKDKFSAVSDKTIVIRVIGNVKNSIGAKSHSTV